MGNFSVVGVEGFSVVVGLGSFSVVGVMNFLGGGLGGGVNRGNRRCG